MKIDFSDNKILKDELEKGNHQALVFLMDTYHHSLCLYAYSLSNNYDEAQDIVQNAFIKLWKNRKKIQSIKSVNFFLKKSVYNKFIDQWRRNKKMLRIETKHIEALDQIMENHIMEEDNLLKKQIKLVKFEIQKLPPKCKQTFLLSKQNGLTNIEIANFMSVSVRTVEAQINKAFRILRKKLKDKIKPILFLLLDVLSI